VPVDEAIRVVVPDGLPEAPAHTLAVEPVPGRAP
jgi:hypothetical protein